MLIAGTSTSSVSICRDGVDVTTWKSSNWKCDDWTQHRKSPSQAELRTSQCPQSPLSLTSPLAPGLVSAAVVWSLWCDLLFSWLAGCILTCLRVHPNLEVAQPSLCNVSQQSAEDQHTLNSAGRQGEEEK